MAIYGCGSECKVGDIVQCIEAPKHPIHPGVPHKYYRVGWIKQLGRGASQYTDIRLEGEEYAPSGGTDSNSRRFILIRRKSGLLDMFPLPKEPQPKFKVGDIVRVRGGRPEWKVCKVHGDQPGFMYSLTFLQSPEQGDCGLYFESSLSPCGEADSLQDFCATIGVSDAKTRNIYHFVETKMLQPLRDKLAQIKEIAQ